MLIFTYSSAYFLLKQKRITALWAVSHSNKEFLKDNITQTLNNSSIDLKFFYIL